MTKSGQQRLAIAVWSDVMCPFCYMGDTLLAKALDQFPHADQIDVRYRSYQLMPHLPVDGGVTATEILVREKDIPRRQADAMNAQVEARAKKLGLEYHLRPSPRSPKGARGGRCRRSEARTRSRHLGRPVLRPSTASTPSPARSPWVRLAGRLRLRGGRSSASSRGSA